jgi:uncharacterized BrkB/YihY/UPF0761 family membrane protein
MNIFEKAIVSIDSFQRRHKPTAFMYAVVKKYGDDQAGYQAALVTYYGFLSLFPLLLVLTTVAGIAGNRDPELGKQLVHSVSSYFPVIGDSLNNSVKGMGKSGPALFIGIIFSLYGARGIADAFRNAVNHLWHVPLAKRSGFPRSLLRSFGLIFGGGGGLIASSIIAVWTSTAGHGILFSLLALLSNLVILYGVFVLILRLSLPLSIPVSKFRVGAAVSAIGLTLLQKLGSHILSSQAAHLSNSYSALFATTLGLLAWIYLQTQVVMYAVQIDTVRDGKFYPRSLSGKNLTPADEHIKKRRS